jgi:hypothetical protein
MLASRFCRPFILFLRLLLIVIAIGCPAILPNHSRAGDTVTSISSSSNQLLPARFSESAQQS